MNKKAQALRLLLSKEDRDVLDRAHHTLGRQISPEEIARQGILACATAIIRTGHMPAPLAVDLRTETQGEQKARLLSRYNIKPKGALK